MRREEQATCADGLSAPSLPDSGGASLLLVATCLLGFLLASLILSFLSSFY